MITFRGGRQATGQRTGLGSSFDGTIRYLRFGSRQEEIASGGVERARWTVTRNLPSEDPDRIPFWMRTQAAQNQRVEKPVYHFGISSAPDEKLTDEQWQQVGDKMLEHLGLQDHQAAMVLHQDREHHHLHIVANRVGHDRRAWKPNYDVLKMQAAARQVEREMGLTLRPTARDLREEKEGLQKKAAATMAVVREDVLPHFRASSSWDQLGRRLGRLGYRLEPAARGGGVNLLDRNGKLKVGISDLHRTISGPRLTEKWGQTLKENLAEHGPPEVASRDPLEDHRTPEELAALLFERKATLSSAQVIRATRTLEEADSVLALLRPLAPGKDGLERFAHPSYLDEETRLYQAADRLATRTSKPIPEQNIAEAVDKLQDRLGYDLSEQQRKALNHTLLGPDLSLMVGRAGSGKSTLMQAAAMAAKDAGYNVRGAALAGVVASRLGDDMEAPSETLAALLLKENLQENDFLIVDEVGMVGTRQMGQLIEQAEEAGAKLLMVGDPDQLKPIGAGDPFRGLLQDYDSALLSEVYRQDKNWMRKASQDLAVGKTQQAIDAYEARGHLVVVKNRKDAILEIADRFQGSYNAAPEASHLAIAYVNNDVKSLNAEIRNRLISDGHLPDQEGLHGYVPGDRILFKKNATDFTVPTIDEAPEADSTAAPNQHSKEAPNQNASATLEEAQHSTEAPNQSASATLEEARQTASEASQNVAQATSDHAIPEPRDPVVDQFHLDEDGLWGRQTPPQPTPKVKPPTESHTPAQEAPGSNAPAPAQDADKPKAPPVSKGVKNGNLGTVESFDDDKLLVRLDSGRLVSVDPEKYRHTQHGYAITVHRSQGTTVDHSYLLLDEYQARDAAYVSLTRHRKNPTIVVDSKTFPNRQSFYESIGRQSGQSLARDFPTAGAEAAPKPTVTSDDRAEKLVTAVNALEARDDAESRLRTQIERLEHQRDSLPKDADLNYLRSRLSTIEPHREFKDALDRVYKDPAAARRALMEDARQLPTEQFHENLQRPEAYGELTLKARLSKAPVEALRTETARLQKEKLVPRKREFQLAKEIHDTLPTLQDQLDHLPPREDLQRAIVELGAPLDDQNFEQALPDKARYAEAYLLRDSARTANDEIDSLVKSWRSEAVAQRLSSKTPKTPSIPRASKASKAPSLPKAPSAKDVSAATRGLLPGSITRPLTVARSLLNFKATTPIHLLGHLGGPAVSAASSAMTSAIAVVQALGRDHEKDKQRGRGGGKGRGGGR